MGLAAVKEDNNLDQVVSAVKQWFDQKGNTRWLLIFDNYDNPKLSTTEDTSAIDIRHYFPDTEQGSIIITTRSSQVGCGHRIELKKLQDIQDSLQILAHTSDRSNVMEDEDARRIADRLDGLPLALATAGAYLRQVGTSFAQYLQLYEESWLKLQQTTPLLDAYDRALYSTWQLSYIHIEQQNALAAKLLQFWAYFDNQDVWYELLHEGVKYCDKATWVSELVKDELSFIKVVRVICHHGLIEVETSLEEGATESRGYSMHGCVHAWTKHVLNLEWNVEMADLALAMVAEHVPVGGSPDSWTTRRRLMQHAAQCSLFILNREPSTTSLWWIAHRLGRLYIEQGKLAQAEKMYTQALTDTEQALGPSHTSTLYTVNNLGVLYWQQGKLAEAEQMYIRALTGREQALGPSHISTLDTVNNLGILYTQQGELVKAEHMYTRALIEKEQALGPSHISTLETVNNLGILYTQQGKLAEAEQMYIRTLTGTEQALGPNHISTLETVNNLGILYTQQGKLAEAEHMYTRALIEKEQVIGPNHTSTLDTVSNLGNLYGQQGELAEAEGRLEEAEGKLAEAEKMYTRALTGYEQALGPNHTSTLGAVHNLSLLYRQQGKLTEVEELTQRFRGRI